MTRNAPKGTEEDAAELDPFGRNFELKDDLRQRDVAAWNRAYVVYDTGKGTADERAACLQAAIEAGWIESPTTRYEDVIDQDGRKERRFYFDGVLLDDLLASEVNYYGLLCSYRFKSLMSVPKASSSQ